MRRLSATATAGPIPLRRRSTQPTPLRAANNPCEAATAAGKIEYGIGSGRMLLPMARRQRRRPPSPTSVALSSPSSSFLQTPPPPPQPPLLPLTLPTPADAPPVVSSKNVGTRSCGCSVGPPITTIADETAELLLLLLLSWLAAMPPPPLSLAPPPPTPSSRTSDGWCGCDNRIGADATCGGGWWWYSTVGAKERPPPPLPPPPFWL
mmetsp:Transcript_33020/g.67542  ORF Transcript_33020/g.67542 Transcript_33020/m.67542 type:complete len:207 (-) Transcript_33020:215-835(-)